MVGATGAGRGAGKCGLKGLRGALLTRPPPHPRLEETLVPWTALDSGALWNHRPSLLEVLCSLCPPHPVLWGFWGNSRPGGWGKSSLILGDGGGGGWQLSEHTLRGDGSAAGLRAQ